MLCSDLMGSARVPLPASRSGPDRAPRVDAHHLRRLHRKAHACFPIRDGPWPRAPPRARAPRSLGIKQGCGPHPHSHSHSLSTMQHFLQRRLFGDQHAGIGLTHTSGSEQSDRQTDRRPSKSRIRRRGAHASSSRPRPAWPHARLPYSES